MALPCAMRSQSGRGLTLCFPALLKKDGHPICMPAADKSTGHATRNPTYNEHAIRQSTINQASQNALRGYGPSSRSRVAKFELLDRQLTVPRSLPSNGTMAVCRAHLCWANWVNDLPWHAPQIDQFKALDNRVISEYVAAQTSQRPAFCDQSSAAFHP